MCLDGIVKFLGHLQTKLQLFDFAFNFQNTKYKNIVKFTFYFFNHTPAKPHFMVVYLIFNCFAYFWFLFLRFDDFKQLLGIF